MNQGKTVVIFATLPDLAGKLNKEDHTHIIKDKHQFLYDPELPIDLMVIDETHYGSHANIFGDVTGLNKAREEINRTETEKEDKALALKELKELEATSKLVSQVKAKVRLQCSGTPYYILCSGEFAETELSGKEIISKVLSSEQSSTRITSTFLYV